jgi:uncharacterized protein
MKFSEHRDDAIHLISGYGPGFVRIRGADYCASLLVSGDRLVPDWPCRSVEVLESGLLAGILELAPEVVLIGSGARLQFPGREALEYFRSRGIGAEVMDTAAACRTYNLLALEGRKVVAALIIS